MTVAFVSLMGSGILGKMTESRVKRIKPSYRRLSITCHDHQKFDLHDLIWCDDDVVIMIMLVVMEIITSSSFMRY
jgi:hypothetical protein